MAIIIRGTGKALPEKKMKNTDFPASLETSDEWIHKHTGISARYIAGEDDCSHLLATAACRGALENIQASSDPAAAQQPVAAADIDVIICATVTGTYKGFPSNACLIQNELSAPHAACFDILAGCSGFLYGLDIAASMLTKHNWRYALVCGSEILSRILDWNDRSTCVLFGDGAGAVLLENTETDARRVGIQSVILGADGSGGQDLYLDNKNHVQMNGHSVYNFAVHCITETIQNLLQKESLALDDIDLFVCHQANWRILDAAAKRLKCDPAKFASNIEDYGNTSSASIPIALDDFFCKGQLHKGMTIILAGFGAGLTWGGCVIRL